MICDHEPIEVNKHSFNCFYFFPLDFWAGDLAEKLRTNAGSCENQKVTQQVKHAVIYPPQNHQEGFTESLNQERGFSSFCAAAPCWPLERMQATRASFIYSLW